MSKEYIIALFILIYLVSLIIHLIFCYKDNKRHIFYMRDFLDEIEFYMWCPIVNTILIIAVIIGAAIAKLYKVSKLDILWEKFKNIKLK